jgi:putative transposase
MKKSQFSEGQIATALRQVDAGAPIPEVTRSLGISEATYYVWRKKYGQMAVAEWADGRGRDSAAAAAGGGEPQTQAARRRFDMGQSDSPGGADKKALKPTRKRTLVREVIGQFPIGVRRACGLLQFNRASWYYRPHRQDDPALRRRLRELAQARPRFGYLRLHVLLRREGWAINRKRVHRLYREEGLIVRLTHRRKRASHLRITPPCPSQGNERWSMDVVADTVLDGRRFRALTVVDNWSRHSSLIEVDFTLTGTKVVTALDRVGKRSGYPQMITVDCKLPHIEDRPKVELSGIIHPGGSHENVSIPRNTNYGDLETRGEWQQSQRLVSRAWD